MEKIMLQKTFTTNNPEEMDNLCNNFKKEHSVKFSTPSVIKDPKNATELKFITVLYYEEYL